jgi:hypothetical protein
MFEKLLKQEKKSFILVRVPSFRFLVFSSDKCEFCKDSVFFGWIHLWMEDEWNT